VSPEGRYRELKHLRKRRRRRRGRGRSRSRQIRKK
jgi:hypothetical protein